jgi:hypothetical protein
MILTTCAPAWMSRLSFLGLLGTLSVGQISAAESPEEAGSSSSAKVVVADVGFATPECVLHLVEDDVYLVSNINGSPFAADGNGFISRLGTDGSVIDLKWIDGSTDGVTLNAPKGMGVSGGTLYVSDVDHVRMFDAKTGAALGEVKIQGSTFLNDVAVSSDGTVYVSDSGFGAGFKPSGSDAIYKISGDGAAEKIIAGEALGHPNGLLAKDSGELVVVSFGSGEVYTVSGGSSAERGAGVRTEQGSLDGIIALGSGEVLISSWGASAVYRGYEAGPFTVVVSGLDAPADIGWDAKRSRVLIPLFKTNVVIIQEIK